MSKLASIDTLDTMIVSILFFISFSSLLRAIFGYFGNHFGVCFSFFENRLILSHEILFLVFFGSDVFGITLTVIKLKIIFHVMSSSAGGHIGIFLGSLWCVVFYFLGNIQWFFIKFFTDF